MHFDSHQVNTGLEKHRGCAFGIGKNMAEATSAGMWKSGVPSSLYGPGANAGRRGITGVRSEGVNVKVKSVVERGRMCKRTAEGASSRQKKSFRHRRKWVNFPWVLTDE